MAFRTSFRPRINTSRPSFSRPKVASTPKVSVPAKAVQPKTKTIIVNRPAPGYNTNNNQGIGSSLAQGAAQGVGAGVGYGVASSLFSSNASAAEVAPQPVYTQAPAVAPEIAPEYQQTPQAYIQQSAPQQVYQPQVAQESGWSGWWILLFVGIIGVLSYKLFTNKVTP